MKYVLFSFIAITLCASCKKDPVTPIFTKPYPYWGEASATINGKLWTAQPSATVNYIHGHGWDIEIDSFYSGILRQALGIYKVPFTPGTYPVINTFPQEDDSMVGGDLGYWTADQADGRYTILESDSSSFVTMQSYDSITKELRGTFDLTFIVFHRPYPSSPDTLRVRNGVFHTKVRDL